MWVNFINQRSDIFIREEKPSYRPRFPTVVVVAQAEAVNSVLTRRGERLRARDQI